MSITADRRRDLLLYVENQILDAKDSATQAVYADLRAMVQGDADRDRLAAEVLRLTDALRHAKRAIVRTLEAGRDRILELGGECDPVDVMERSDPALRAIDLALSPATSTGSEVGT